MTSRRAVLTGIAATAAVPLAGWGAVGHPVALAAAKTPDGRHHLVGLGAQGQIRFTRPLPSRGHAGAAHPQLAQAVIMARRPGRFALVLDCTSGAVLAEIQAPKGRHFYGHCAFSTAGDLLYTTENDIQTGDGRIGVWRYDTGFARVAEFATHGIGPHEIIRLHSGDLAIANGGIRTHPNTGRQKLNLDQMQPNLAVISPDGRLKDLAPLPRAIRPNSLRHIAALPSGAVLCGFQWQGDPYDAPPLLGLYRGRGQVQMLNSAETVQHRLRGYIGSVCALGPQGFAATSPRGGVVLHSNDAQSRPNITRATDICGLCPIATGALATDGLGRVYHLTTQGLRPLAQHNLAFDNHLIPVTPA